MRLKFQYIVIILVSFLTLCSQDVWAKPRFTIVIDPGHGGGDTGTPHRRCKLDEKTVALNVATRLGRLIEWNYKDVKVVYTRKTDFYPSLPDRVKKAKEAKGDLYISIHVNACPDPKATGFETYVFGIDGTSDAKKRVEERLIEERENLDISGRSVNFDTDVDIETKILAQAQREKHNVQSLEVAKAVQSSLISTLKKTSYASQTKNRGVKQKNLFVLCFAPMPAILVELGYMSNISEEKFLTSEEGMECFANAIYKGFQDYKSKWDKRQLSNTTADEDEPEKPSKPYYQQEESKTEQKPKAEEQKTKVEKKKPAEAKPVEPVQTQNGGVTWRIQFLSSDRLLKEGAREFKGLKNVTYYKDGKMYRYTYGNAKQSKDLNKELKNVKALFPDAFPVKIGSDGNRAK